MSNPTPIVSVVQLGIANGSTPIVVDLDASTQQFDPVEVTLSASYTQATPANGFVFGEPGQPWNGPKSYNSGATVTFWRCEAAALVAAGVAAYA